MTPWIYPLLLFGLVLRVAAWDESRVLADRGCAILAHAKKTGQFPTLEGEIEAFPNGHLGLSRTKLEGEGASQPFDAEVLITIPVLAPELGRNLSISGPFSCTPPYRNPGVLADGWDRLARPRLILSGYRSQWRLGPGRDWRELRPWITAWLLRRFAPAPTLLGLELDLWTGDLSRLPDALVQKYREAGVWHLLAQGALRVVGFSWVVLVLLALVAWIFFPFRSLRVGALYELARRLTPLFCAGFLFFAGGKGLEKVFALLLLGHLLRFRHLSVTAGQRLSSCLALLVAWTPERVANPGFWFAGAGTAIVVTMLEEPMPEWASYLFFSVIVPIFFFPFSAFFSARIAPLAPFCTAALTWIWCGFLLPLGYLLPLFLWPFPLRATDRILPSLDRVLASIFSKGVPFGSSFAVPRPNWIEFLLLVALTCFFLSMARGVFRTVCRRVET